MRTGQEGGSAASVDARHRDNWAGWQATAATRWGAWPGLVGRPIEVMMKQVSEEPVAPSLACEEPVPAELDVVILGCMAKEPDARINSMEQVGAALQAIRFDRPWDPSRARSWWASHIPA